MSKPECRRNEAANLRHLIIRHSFELRHSDFTIVLIFLGNPSFVSGQGWMARKRKRRKGETPIRGGRCPFAHSPILRFAGSPTQCHGRGCGVGRGLGVALDGAVAVGVAVGEGVVSGILGVGLGLGGTVAVAVGVGDGVPPPCTAVRMLIRPQP